MQDYATAVECPPRGYQSRLERIPGLATALRLCRFQTEDGHWIGLAQLARRVPDEHTSKACTIGRGPECWVVHCVCGAVNFVAAAMVECRGGCERWFVADAAGAFSFRLPPQEADDE